MLSGNASRSLWEEMDGVPHHNANRAKNDFWFTWSAMPSPHARIRIIGFHQLLPELSGQVGGCTLCLEAKEPEPFSIRSRFEYQLGTGYHVL
jgi:hypothetical protein